MGGMYESNGERKWVTLRARGGVRCKCICNVYRAERTWSGGLPREKRTLTSQLSIPRPERLPMLGCRGGSSSWQTATSRDISSDTVEAAALSHAYSRCLVFTTTVLSCTRGYVHPRHKSGVHRTTTCFEESTAEAGVTRVAGNTTLPSGGQSPSLLLCFTRLAGGFPVVSVVQPASVRRARHVAFRLLGSCRIG